jgi:hypothetical protein
MDSTRITVSLERTEKSALMKLAMAELRDPRDQLRYVLRRELERLGLLQPITPIIPPGGHP